MLLTSNEEHLGILVLLILIQYVNVYELLSDKKA